MAGVGSAESFMEPKEGRSALIGGRYKPIRPLGRGAFSSVVLAEDIVRREKVAVKVLHQSLSASEPLQRLMEMEAKILSLFDNHRIVRLLGSGEGFIAMERLEGHASTAFHFGQAGVLELVSEACEALLCIHSRGIVHRDVKPEHLMVVHGSLKLIDFGYAKLRGGWDYSRTAGHGIGTPAFMSPELTRNAWEVDARSDIYSLGVIMYEKLSGSLPFKDADPKTVMDMHLHAEPPPLPRSIHPAVRGIVSRAMAKKPEDRFQDAMEMKDAVDSASRSI